MKTASFFRMKPAVALSLAFCFATSAFGGSMLWNEGFSFRPGLHSGRPAVSLWWSGCPDEARYYGITYYPGWIRMLPNVEFNVVVSGSTATISPVQAGMGGLLAAYGDNWVRSEPGDVVDASTTRNLESYFFKGWMDYEPGMEVGYSDYDIVTTAGTGDPFYLSFATEAIGDRVVYGWVALSVDADGVPSIVGSCVDLSGAPLVVGQIPEPSSACLAAMGAAMLLWRAKAGRRSTA